MSDDEAYSDDFGSLDQDPDKSHRDGSKSASASGLHRSVVGAGENASGSDEERYSEDAFEAHDATTLDVSVSAAQASSLLGVNLPTRPSGRHEEASSLGERSSAASPSSSSAGAGNPRGKVMSMADLLSAQRSSVPDAAASSRNSVASSDAGVGRASVRADQSDRIGDGLGAGGAAGSSGLQANVLSKIALTTQDAEAEPWLPSTVARWRIPDRIGTLGVTAGAEEHATEALPPASSQRIHDAVPRHLKPHAWDLASLGQEAPGQAPPLPQHPLGVGPRGFSGQRGLLTAGVESTVVDRLAQQFVLGRKAPTLQRNERAAYQEMLEQVAWTALEPAAAQEAAKLLGQRWLSPVSSQETLRAFRRCLHAILTDERVLDVVQHQMTLHFMRTTSGPSSEATLEP